MPQIRKPKAPDHRIGQSLLYQLVPSIVKALHFRREVSKSQRYTIFTHIDHGIGCYPKECGSLVDLFDFLVALSRQLQGLQLTEGTLQGSAMLSYQVIARAQVLHFAGEGSECVLKLSLVSL